MANRIWLDKELGKKSFLDAQQLLRLAIWLLFFGGAIALWKLNSIEKEVERLAQQPPPTMVQTIDGKVMQIQAKDSKFRSLPTIENFVRQWATLTYTWGTIPSEGKKPVPASDTGEAVSFVENGQTVVKQIPTPALIGAFLISDENNFRLNFLSNLGNRAAQVEGVFEGTLETQLSITDIVIFPRSEPGVWDVKLTSFIRVSDSRGRISQPIKNNLQLTVIAVPAPDHPLEAGMSPLQQAAYRLGLYGLLISDAQERGS